MSKPIISIKNLSFANVFNNFSLSIPAGVNFAIAGENGIGKTTLMKILCGLLPTYKGIITFFNGKHHTDWDVGYCSQHSSWPLDVKIKNILRLFAKVHNISWDSMIANPLFSSLRINNIANYKSQRLSGGQNRRLVLFLTLFYNPRIVFLDEPFNDIDERKNMIAILKNYCFSNHIQIILISHSIYELKQLTKMGVFLSNNKKKNKIYSTKQLNGLLIKKFKSQ